MSGEHTDYDERQAPREWWWDKPVEATLLPDMRSGVARG